MSECIHIIVSGRVQGVYFRAFTQKQAQKLNISGYAKNLSNGDVEIVAKGEKSLIEQFINCCHKGSILAKVNKVKILQPSSEKEFVGFEIL